MEKTSIERQEELAKKSEMISRISYVIEDKVFDRLLGGPFGMNFEGCQVKVRSMEQHINNVYKIVDSESKMIEQRT